MFWLTVRTFPCLWRTMFLFLKYMTPWTIYYSTSEAHETLRIVLFLLAQNSGELEGIELFGRALPNLFISTYSRCIFANLLLTVIALSILPLFELLKDSDLYCSNRVSQLGSFKTIDCFFQILKEACVREDSFQLSFMQPGLLTSLSHGKQGECILPNHWSLLCPARYTLTGECENEKTYSFSTGWAHFRSPMFLEEYVDLKWVVNISKCHSSWFRSLSHIKCREKYLKILPLTFVYLKRGRSLTDCNLATLPFNLASLFDDGSRVATFNITD